MKTHQIIQKYPIFFNNDTSILFLNPWIHIYSVDNMTIFRKNQKISCFYKQ